MRRLIFATILLAPALTVAQGFGSSSRAQSWDFAFNVIYQDSMGVGGENGSSLNVDSAWGFGLGFDYNFNERFSLGADLDFLRPDYSAVLVEDVIPPSTTTVNHQLSQFNGRIIGTFNMMDGPLVPYIDAGFGWTYVDSNVADGPPQHRLLVASLVGIHLLELLEYVLVNGNVVWCRSWPSLRDSWRFIHQRELQLLEIE